MRLGYYEVRVCCCEVSEVRQVAECGYRVLLLSPVLYSDASICCSMVIVCPGCVVGDMVVTTYVFRFWVMLFSY